MKSGGYKECSVNIAYISQNNLFSSFIKVIMPVLQPNPLIDYN
jgi:hypothetical protein